MAAETSDQTEGTSKDTSVQLENMSSEPSAMDSLANDYAPKARKPYTITKQRERWSAEEHQRFLEALKLYGRAWRQIKEHVGTKSAIQIRSHAQKFFAKVAKDSIHESKDPIEIPPPRPKKRPLHPYPRKVAGSPKAGILLSTKPERSPSPNISVGRDHRSPTSVLSTIVSDAFESAIPEVHNSDLSPASCTTRAHSPNNLDRENDSECMTSNLSKEEKGSPHKRSAMESEFLTGDKAGSGEDSATEARSATIKLFGRTVSVKDTPSSCISAAKKVKSGTTEEKIDTNNDNPLGSFINPQLSFVIAPSSIAPWTCGLPQHGVSEEHGNGVQVVPWWSWNQGLVCPHCSSVGQPPVKTAAEYSFTEGVKGEEYWSEASLSGSSNGSVTEVNSRRKSFEAFDSKELSNFEKRCCGRGFVPYKRCLAEREATSSMVALEEPDGQRARVYS